MIRPKGFRAANKRYLMIFVPMMALYCAALIFAMTFIDMKTASAAARTGAALGVSLPLAAILWSIMRLVRETDEYTRLRQLQALSEAGVMLTALVFVLGFMERFNVIPDIPLFLFGPAFFFLYGFAHVRQILGKTV
ncbi:hypothetical protein K1X12_03235 [Hyphomonas sp. WL0036]|uniref:hypothetical protein n=1 Tax=Hyphomonas sediminis TaxID=2866160 RepID=UPI001C811244|nr:hypothetical protein [Hyphomonas sediminis]MBY9065893.1 hypothetical protein [Hyphomonas sediminis]